MISQESSGFMRISKAAARKEFEKGSEVYLLPCKVRLDNMWIKPHLMTKEVKFDSFMATYSYYNCQDKDLGLYPAFFKKKEGR